MDSLKLDVVFASDTTGSVRLDIDGAQSVFATTPTIAPGEPASSISLTLGAITIVGATPASGARIR